MGSSIMRGAAIFMAALTPEVYAEVQRAEAPTSRTASFESGLARAPKSRSFEESSRRVQRVLQFFTPDWIDAKPQTSPGDAARGMPQLASPLSVLQSLGEIRRSTLGAATRGLPEEDEPDSNPEGGSSLSPQGSKTMSAGGGRALGKDGSGPAEVLPYWMPFCFLVDPSANPQQVNAKIKYIADEYAKCGIVVETHSFTMKSNYPADPAALQGMAKAACNFDERFGVRGAVQLDVNSRDIPVTMCNDPTATGCSTLCEPISVSLMAPNSSPVLGLHESMHSNCCGRLCVNRGLGTEPGGPGIDLVWNFEKATREFHAEGPNIQGEPITAAACESLRQGATANDGTHRWAPERQRYYARADDPAKQVDITRYATLFPPPRGRTLARTGGGESASPPVETTGTRIGYVDAPKATETAVAQKTGGGADARHQNKSATAKTLLGAVRRETPDPDSLQLTQGLPSGSVGSAGKPSQSIGYDDDAPKSAPSGTTSPSQKKGTGYSMSSAGEPSSRIGYDDDAPKGQSAGTPNPSARIGYDDDARGGDVPAASAKGTPGAPEVFRRSDKVVLGSKKKRKRGAALKRKGNALSRGPSVFKRQTDVIISTRPAPDFTVQSDFGEPDVEVD